MKTGETVPDADESKQFWSGIWGEAVEHEQNAEWLKELQGERPGESQEDPKLESPRS